MHKPSRCITPDGRLLTPYAPRAMIARRNTDYPTSMNRTMSRQKPYYSLSDPHLANYFKTKLVSSGQDTRPATAQGYDVVYADTPRRPRVQESRSCYTVSVKTGSQRTAGTDARVYITLHGTKAKVGRKRLVRGGRGEFRFVLGSQEKFRLRGRDIGELTHVVVEHDGLRAEQGWYLERVIVTKGEEGQRWLCPCDHWISLHHSDQQLSRVLKAHPVRQGNSSVEYTVDVYTGNVRGGGTDANVFLTLVGTQATTPKTQLKDCSLDRGSVASVRVVAAKDLGTLTSAEIEQDCSGFGPDWFLDKVVSQTLVVYKSSQPEKKEVFPCYQWLSRKEGDGETRRELHPSSSHQPREGKRYVITTLTGGVRGAGTDANVFITLYGSVGNSGERRLDNDVANFERGRRDTFQLNCPNVGHMERLKVRHDNSGVGPGWFLEWVDVCDDEGERWHFPCGQWLDVREGDGEIDRMLTEGEGKTDEKQEPEGHPYTIHVTTGNCPGAGTNTNVYITLHDGEGGDSGRIWLDNGQRSFLTGHTDTFEVISPQLLSSVEMVTVGHDNTGIGPGWFLEKVVLESSHGDSWEFECHRWLCLDEGDGRIERELHRSVQPVKAEAGKEWTVHVWTSDIRGAGTDANVTLQVHGDRGSSDVFPLGDATDNFEQGEKDSFHAPLTASLGNVTAITMGHDGSGPYPDWHLEKVVMECFPKEWLMFPCGRWLGAEERVKIDAIRQTDSSADKPSTRHNPLQSATTLPSDHEEVDYGSDQFESISEESEDSNEERQDTPHDLDSSITNEYICQLRYAQMSSIDSSSHVQSDHSPLPSLHKAVSPHGLNTTIPYTVHVTMGTRPSPGVSSHLVLVLVGDRGSTPPIHLEPVRKVGLQSPGKMETFSVEGSCVGSLSQLKVKSEGSERLLVEEITVRSPTTGHTHSFPWGQWVELEQEYTLDAMELEASADTSSLARSKDTVIPTSSGLVAYEVKVFTADKKQAGTTNNLHLIVFGDQGSSREVVIRNPSRDPLFQRGQTDSVQIAISDVGKLTALKIAHCSKRKKGKESSQWYLFKVVLTKLVDKTKYQFLCRQWIKQSTVEDIVYIQIESECL